MPRARFARLAPDRQASLLDAAAREFAAHGFADASYNRIIAAAGVSKGAMYYYFEDKGDLYATVVRRALDDVLAAVGPLPAIADAASFWEAVEARLSAGFAVLTSRPDLAELGRHVYGQVSSSPDGPLAELIDEIRSATVDVLEVGVGVGAVRSDLPADLLARMALGAGVALDHWFLERWTVAPAAPLLAHASEGLALLRRMLEPPA